MRIFNDRRRAGRRGAATRLDTDATGTAGYVVYGDVALDHMMFAVRADTGAICQNTTIWLDTDLDRTTGYRIRGSAGGTPVGALDDAFSADGRPPDLAAERRHRQRLTGPRPRRRR